MKAILLIAIISLLTINADGQPSKNKFSMGAGASLAIPVYNMTFSSTGGGVDITAAYGITHKLAAIADIGFAGLPGKTVYPSTAIVPIRLGAKYYPFHKVFVQAKAGLGIYTILKTSAHYTAYSAGGGYFFSKKIEAGLFYDGYTNKHASFAYAGFRAAYNFISQ